MKSKTNNTRRGKRIQPAPKRTPSGETPGQLVEGRIDASTGLPEPPLIPAGLSGEAPNITQKEVLAYVNARDTFIVAKLDFERKRANLLYGLRMLREVEPGTYEATLDRSDEETVRIVSHEHSDGVVIRTEHLSRGE